MASYLLEIDEGEQLFDQQDVEQFKATKAAVATKAGEMQEFERSYRAKSASMVAAAAAAKGPSPPVVAEAAVVKLGLPHDIEQAWMKPFLPPRCHLWRDNKRGGWCGQCRDEKRISESNARHGSSKEACKEVLRRLWLQHSRIESVSVDLVCHVANLFSES